LILFFNNCGELGLREKAIGVHRVLHKDLGRTGSYLGGISPQFQEDIKKHKSMIDG
jgi:hypothetical protein